MRMTGIMGVLMVVLASATGLAESTNLYCFPARYINQRRVALAPLIQWWKDADDPSPLHGKLAPRPLTAWVRIKSITVEEFHLGWKIEAQLWDSPRSKPTQQKIFLKSPPREQQASFEALKRRDAELLAVNQTMMAAANANESEARESFRRQGNLYDVADAIGYRNRGINAAAQSYGQTGSQALDRAASQTQRVIAANEERSRVLGELTKFPAGDRYRVDFFAMKTGETSFGLPVYDQGRMMEQ